MCVNDQTAFKANSWFLHTLPMHWQARTTSMHTQIYDGAFKDSCADGFNGGTGSAVPILSCKCQFGYVGQFIVMEMYV